MKPHKLPIAAALFLLESVFQIAGGLLYDVCPAWVWSVCDASLMMIPLLFGLRIGLLACIPNTIAEIVWTVVYGYLSPLFHAAAFLIAAAALGCVKEGLDRRAVRRAIPIKLVCFELFLIIEELLYVLLRVACGTSPIEALTWERVSVDFWSAGNLLCAAIGLAVLWKRGRAKADGEAEEPRSDGGSSVAI